MTETSKTLFLYSYLKTFLNLVDNLTLYLHIFFLKYFPTDKNKLADSLTNDFLTVFYCVFIKYFY